MKRISLVLLDDLSAPCEGLTGLLQAWPDFQVLAAAAVPLAALRKVRKAKPDLVLLHLGWEAGVGVMLAGALREKLPESRVIILGLDPADGDVASFVRARVSGFIMADASLDRHQSTIRSVARGIQILPAELVRRLFGQLVDPGFWGQPPRMRDFERLGNPERAVAELMVQGWSDQAIAARLQLGLQTIKSQVRLALGKLARHGRLKVTAFSKEAARAAPV